jgi:hypothetical protein
MGDEQRRIDDEDAGGIATRGRAGCVPVRRHRGREKGYRPEELAGSWQGWVTGEQGQERATMIVQANGNYKASTVRGSTSEGQFYLQDGKLLYRSSRTTGKAQLTEDKGKTTLSVIPDDPNYRTGRGDYERVK